MAVWPTQVVLLLIAAWVNRNRINPDAISYLRIAQYYMNGQTDLMLSGYWGPLLSWLIAPWLLVFADPLLAARAAMAVTAVVFLFGCFCILRAAQLPGAALIFGTWIASLLGVAWSVVVITPDLLMSGLLCCGISRLWSDRWMTHTGTALGAGMVLGASYLAKSVALPVSVLIILWWAGTLIVVSRSNLWQAVRATAITLAGFLVVAGPWIGMLSSKYGHPVFATSGPIAHAIVGPPDMERESHPVFLAFHKPETGRITSWEDPTSLPYKYWSPLENVTYAVHQVRVIFGNANLIVQCLKTFDWLGLGLVSTIYGALFGTPWRKSLLEERWRWAFIPVVSVSVIYLPVYAKDDRYYWVTLPFLLAASFGSALRLSSLIPKQHEVQRALALALVILSFIIGHGNAFRGTLHPHQRYLAAKILADKLTMAGLVGPIASVGPDLSIALYVAYHLNVPWFGRSKGYDTAEILASGAALIIVPRSTVMAKQLREEPRLTSADKQLFGCDETREAFPFEVYLTRSRSTHDTCSEHEPGS